MKKLVVFALVPLAFLTVACDGEGLPELPAGTAAPGDAGETEAPPEETEAPPEETEAPPEETEAPPEETEAPPEETEAPPEETSPPEATDAPEDESDDGSNTALIVIAIIAAVALLIGVIALATRGRSTPATAPAADPRRQVVATARWVHDQLSLELLALPPAESQQRWAIERSRLDRLVIDARTISPDRNAPAAWESLAQSVAALQSSLDTAIRMRAAPGADPDLVRESVTLANARRAELQQALLVAQQL